MLITMYMIHIKIVYMCDIFNIIHMRFTFVLFVTGYQTLGISVTQSLRGNLQQ